MRCPKCLSTAVRERPERTAQGYRGFRCLDSRSPASPSEGQDPPRPWIPAFADITPSDGAAERGVRGLEQATDSCGNRKRCFNKIWRKRKSESGTAYRSRRPLDA